MDSFELNKIIGAILGTLLFVMGIGFLAEAIYEPGPGKGPGYNLPAPAETETGDTTTAAPAAPVDIGTLLASADPKAGEASAKKCAACHDFTSGGPNKIGPNLYDVVERPIASHPGFAYSDALTKFKAETWTYQHLDEWLLSPKAMAPGTKMTFAGVPDDKERANIIAYLSTLSASPKPFPAPAPAAPAASSAPAPADASSSAAAPAASSAPASSATPAPASSSAAAPASSAAAPASAASSSSAAQ